MNHFYRQRMRQGCIWFILPTITINNIPEQRDRYVFTLADFPWASLIIYADHPWMRIQWINNKNIKNLLIHWKCTSLGLDEALYHLYNLSLFCILYHILHPPPLHQQLRPKYLHQSNLTHPNLWWQQYAENRKEFDTNATLSHFR